MGCSSKIAVCSFSDELRHSRKRIEINCFEYVSSTLTYKHFLGSEYHISFIFMVLFTKVKFHSDLNSLTNQVIDRPIL